MPEVLAMQDYATLEYERDDYGHIFLHLKLKEFSLSTYKRMRRDWVLVKEFLSNKGYREIYVIIPQDDPFLEKFEQRFGFSRFMDYNGTTVLRQEI